MQLAQLETELEEHVLLYSRTFSIGNVEAKYNPGRSTYDWEATCREKASQMDKDEWDELVVKYTSVIPPTPASEVIDWRGIAHIRNWEGKVTKPAKPSVKFNLLEDTWRVK